MPERQKCQQSKPGQLFLIPPDFPGRNRVQANHEQTIQPKEPIARWVGFMIPCMRQHQTGPVPRRSRRVCLLLREKGKPVFFFFEKHPGTRVSLDSVPGIEIRWSESRPRAQETRLLCREDHSPGHVLLPPCSGRILIQQPKKGSLS